MTDVDLKGVHVVVVNGKEYHYAWRGRGAPRLRGEPGSLEYIASYHDALKARRERSGYVLKSVIAAYLAASDFMKLADSTQTEYRRLLRALEDAFGDMPLQAFNDKKDVKKIKRELLEYRDKMHAEDKLRESENRLTVLQRVLSWAVDRGTIETNPLDTWERHYKSDRADRIWTPHHIDAFVEKASPEMRRALLLALYTGQRQGDLLRLTWAQYRGGSLYIRQRKTHQAIVVECIDQLRTMLDEVRGRPVQSTHILATRNSHPWQKRHFSRQFKETCDRAGIVGLTFHDLRGTAVTLLAEAGCDVPQIAAITGHTLRSASAILEKYMARTRAQGAAAMAKLENYLRTESVKRLVKNDETEADETPGGRANG